MPGKEKNAQFPGQKNRQRILALRQSRQDFGMSDVRNPRRPQRFFVQWRRHHRIATGVPNQTDRLFNRAESGFPAGGGNFSPPPLPRSCGRHKFNGSPPQRTAAAPLKRRQPQTDAGDPRRRFPDAFGTDQNQTGLPPHTAADRRPNRNLRSDAGGISARYRQNRQPFLSSHKNRL